MTNGTELRGVKGWLAFFLIMTVVIGPLLALAMIAGSLSQAEYANPQLASNQIWQGYKTQTWFLTVCALLCSIYAGLRLWQVHKPSSVSLMIYMMWGLTVTVPFLTVLILKINFPSVSLAQAIFESISSFFASAISATIWTLYLKKSRRIKNTYYIIDNAPQTKKVAPLSVGKGNSEPHQHTADQSEEVLWEEASLELNSDARRPGLWAKSFALAEGDTNRASSLYLKERVEELRQQKASLAEQKEIESQGIPPITPSDVAIASSKRSDEASLSAVALIGFIVLILGFGILGYHTEKETKTEKKKPYQGSTYWKDGKFNDVMYRLNYYPNTLKKISSTLLQVDVLIWFDKRTDLRFDGFSEIYKNVDGVIVAMEIDCATKRKREVEKIPMKVFSQIPHGDSDGVRIDNGGLYSSKTTFESDIHVEAICHLYM